MLRYSESSEWRRQLFFKQKIRNQFNNHLELNLEAPKHIFYFQISNSAMLKADDIHFQLIESFQIRAYPDGLAAKMQDSVTFGIRITRYDREIVPP
jgi:hypothetical protein